MNQSDAPSNSRPTNSASAGPTPQRQLTLRGLFTSTTYFAISSALASQLGIGIFVLMNGLFLTWLGWRGYLWWMQTHQARPKLFGLGWLLFGISFALPAMTVKGCGNGTPTVYYGWEVAISTAGAVEGTWNEARSLNQDPRRRTIKGVAEIGLSFLTVCLWNLPNLLMLASPFILVRLQRGKGQILSALMGCAAVSSWMWGINAGEELRIGYYVWSSAITVISLARPPTGRSVLAMGVVAAIWILGIVTGVSV